MHNTLRHLLCATAFGAAAMAVPASAQTEPVAAEPAAGAVLDEAEALAVDAKMYAAEFGVTFDEAVERLTIMVYGTGAVSEAASGEGTDLAGRYFDNNAAEFGLVVATKKSQKAPKTLSFTPRTKENYGRLTSETRRARNEQRKEGRRIAKLSESEVTKAENALGKPGSLKVRYSVGKAHNLLELTEAVSTLVNGKGSIPGFQLAFVDEIKSNVQVMSTVRLTDAQQREVRQLVKVPVEFEFLATPIRQVANMRGGSKLYNSSAATSTSARECMTAFGVRHATIKTSAGAAMTGMVTAAHCNTATNVIADDARNYALTHGHVDDTRGLNNIGETDISFVHGANNNPAGLGTFYYDGTTNVRSVTGTQSRGGTAVGSGTWNQVTGTAVGSYICHVGQTSPGSTTNMQSCGEVISVNADQSEDGKVVNQTGGFFVMVRNTSSGKGTVLGSTGSGTLRCHYGDSGGPWFAGTVAYGVMSACHWSDADNGNRAAFSLYTSLDYLNWIGSTIIVP